MTRSFTNPLGDYAAIYGIINFVSAGITKERIHGLVRLFDGQVPSFNHLLNVTSIIAISPILIIGRELLLYLIIVEIKVVGVSEALADLSTSSEVLSNGCSTTRSNDRTQSIITVQFF